MRNPACYQHKAGEKFITILLFFLVTFFVSFNNFFTPALATSGDIYAKDVIYRASTYSQHPKPYPSSEWGASVDLNVGSGWDDYRFPLHAPNNGAITVNSTSGGWGKSIIWTSSDGSERIFLAHLDEIVKTGAVNGGDVIAYVGNTGISTAPHVHANRSVNRSPASLVLSGVQIVPGNSYKSIGPLGTTLQPPVTPPPLRPYGPDEMYYVWRGGTDALNRYVGIVAQSFKATFPRIKSVTFNAAITGGNGKADVKIFSNEAQTQQVGTTREVTVNNYGETTVEWQNGLSVTSGNTYWLQILPQASGTLIIYFTKYSTEYGDGSLYLDWVKQPSYDLNASIRGDVPPIRQYDPDEMYYVWRGGTDALNRYVGIAAQSFKATFPRIKSVTFNAAITGGNGKADVKIFSNEAQTQQVGTTREVTVNNYGETTVEWQNGLSVTSGNTYWLQILPQASGTLIIYFTKYSTEYGDGSLYLDWVKQPSYDLNASIRALLDSTPPITTIGMTPSSPDGLNGWYKTSPSVTLSSSEQPSTTYYRIDSGTTQTYSAPFTIPDGERTVYYQSVDQAANWESLKNFSIKVDTIIPSHPIINQPTSPTRNSSLILSGTAEANSTVRIYDGANYLGSANANAQGAFSINLSNLSEGVHSLTAKAIDLAGNESGASEAKILTVNIAPPSGNFLINSGNSYTNSLNVSTNSSVTGATKMRLKVGSNWEAWESYISDKALTFSAGDGIKTVYAEYSDDAGNDLILSDSIILDTKAPIFTLRGLSANPKRLSYINKNLILKPQPSDAYGIGSVEFYVDGKLKDKKLGPPFTYSFQVKRAKNRLYKLEIKATDNACNSSSILRKFYVDTFKPIAKLSVKGFPLRKPGTTIRFKLIEAFKMKVKAFLMIKKGKTVVKSIFKNRWLDAKSGSGKAYSIKWNGKNTKNKLVPVGTYTIWLTLTDPAGNKGVIINKVKVTR